MRDIITRFAPAPTGFLHLGHVVNAIFVWGMVRRVGGRVLLRVEDHDRQRSRAGFEQAIVDDLAWLGFAADAPLVRQSERGEIYARALARLQSQGLIYACGCARVDRYPGTCRDRNLADGRGSALRVRLDPSVERFVDLRHGLQEQRPSEQCGDMVIRDRDGNWTYQFAVTVDDLEQGVTLVVRGDDLLDSTGRQLQLARLLGRENPPRFFHHPLIMKSATQKLSKSDHDTGVRDLRAAGWTAERVIGQAARMAGLLTELRDVHAADVSSIISL
jgi:glutamyl-Q tRNA(Asp) synthetase